MIACQRGWPRVLHPPRPGEACPVAAVIASSDVAATEIRLTLLDGKMVVLNADEL